MEKDFSSVHSSDEACPVSLKQSFYYTLNLLVGMSLYITVHDVDKLFQLPFRCVNAHRISAPDLVQICSGGITTYHNLMSRRNLQIDSYSVRLGVVLMFLQFFDYYGNCLYDRRFCQALPLSF